MAKSADPPKPAGQGGTTGGGKGQAPLKGGNSGPSGGMSSGKLTPPKALPTTNGTAKNANKLPRP